MSGLMEAFHGGDDQKGKDALLSASEKGQFNLRDMYKQIEKVLSMGSLGKLMGMVSAARGLDN